MVRLARLASALLAAGLISGCGSEKAGETARFADTPSSCAQAVAPAAAAVRDFLGPLFSERAGYESTDRGSTPETSVLSCDAAYHSEQPWVAGDPLHRTITMTFSLERGADGLAEAEQQFARGLGNREGARVAGPGDDAFEFWRDDTAGTTFRISNAVVSVEVFGSTMSARPPTTGPRAARADVAPGARAIAEALARDVDALDTPV